MKDNEYTFPAAPHSVKIEFDNDSMYYDFKEYESTMNGDPANEHGYRYHSFCDDSNDELSIKIK